MTCPRSGTHLDHVAAGREPQPSLERLGGYQGQLVGNWGDQVGVSVAMERGESPSVCHPFPFSVSLGSNGTQCPRSRGVFVANEGSNGNCGLSVLPGVLRKDIRRPESLGGVETGPGPLPTEQIPERNVLPHGIPNVNQGFHQERRLGSLDRPSRRILPCPYSSEGPEISKVRLEGDSISVSCPSIRTRSSSLAIFKNSKRSGNPVEGDWNPPQDLPRRLVASGELSSALSEPSTEHSSSLLPVGLRSQSSKVRSGALPDFLLPRGDFRHNPVDVSSDAGPSSSPEQLSVLPLGFSSDTGQNSGFAPRLDGIAVVSSSTWSTAQARASASFSRQMEAEIGPLEQDYSSGTLVSSCNHTVVSGALAHSRCADSSPSTSGSGLYGCLECGLGRPCRCSYGLGIMGSDSSQLAHQSPRDGGGSTLLAEIPSSATRETSAAEHRQHDSCVLPQQTGGGKVSISFSEGRGSPPLVPITQHSSDGKICSREVEHTGRQPQQEPHGTEFRMDASTQCSISSVAKMVQTSNRSLCHPIQSQASAVCISGPGPSSVGDRCAVNKLGKSDRLRLSSNCPDRQSSQKDKRRTSNSYSGSPKLASAALVSGTATHVACSSTKTASREQVPSATKVGYQPQGPSNLGPTRLASVRASLLSQGASSSVVDLVSASHRRGTQSVYSSHWKRWVHWCNSNQVNPLSPTHMNLGNFLGHLSRDLKLSASTLRVHRSAISSTISLLGGPSFSDDSLLRSITKGAALNDAKNPRKSPEWDIFLVLNHLKNYPYEPLRSCSLEHLTLKTVFLISLASARRSSEIHAFSGNPEDYAFEQNGGICLNFVSSFIAKNQIPGSKSPSVFIDKLFRKKTDHSDRLLCPVRALRIYLRRTKEFRSDRKRLFISYNKKYKKDIKKQTIARWLKTVIKAAYQRPERDLIPFNPRPHDIRAWSASLALANDVTLDDILKAAYWRSTGTFIRHYLKPVAHLRGDGSSGISSLVVAQRAVSSLDS